MTTSTVTSPIDHSNTTGFRAWGSEFNGQLAAVGLVQTADTGQINWSTVAYNSSPNTTAGYEVWRFADSTLYIKFEYGTGSNGAGYPSIFVTVGTGSNGSGTITGTNVTSSRVGTHTGSTPTSTTASYSSYFTRTANHFGFLWKAAAASPTPLAYYILGKTVNGSGAATTTGYGHIYSNAQASVPVMQSVRLIATAGVQLASSQFCLVPGNPANSIDSAGNIQAYECYVNVPDVLPFMYACGLNFSDVPRGTTFSVNMVGATAHTYLGLGYTGGLNNASASLYGLGMLYE